MAENFDTGHAVNAANFKMLVGYATTWGASYKPPVKDLTLGALQALNTQVQSAVESLATLEGLAMEPQKQRTQLVDQLDDKARGIISTMKVLGIDKALLERAKAVSDLVTGSNVSKMSQKRKQEAEIAATAGQVPASDSRKGTSVSQQSLVKRLGNFGDLLKMVAGFSNYKPSAEDEYSLPNLTAFLATVQKASDDAAAAENPLMQARTQRNTFLYDETTGAVAIAARVKQEIARTLKKTSAEYKQVSALKFTKLKK
ncbi:MAG: hypothetical protein V4714_05445 [Bacteroidota bacterium]